MLVNVSPGHSGSELMTALRERHERTGSLTKLIKPTILGRPATSYRAQVKPREMDPPHPPAANLESSRSTLSE